MLTYRSILHSLVVVFFCLAPLAYAEVVEAAPIGKVTKVQNQAQVGSRTAGVGTPVNQNDRIRTGPKARLQITFVDGTVFTVGENASVVIDQYVYNPATSTGRMAVRSASGALRFTTGKLHDMRNKKVTVKTPYAALAVRGTDFWMGPIDGHYGALLLKGKVDVATQRGTVKLNKPKYGTDIYVPRRRRR
jgi:hypothetical protein